MQDFTGLFLIGLLSLIIGSFLNVVIYRLPIMIKNAWEAECQEYLSMTTTEPKQKINLCFPRSYCPHCSTPLRWWHNIPLLSYILLRGRCAHCKTTISFRYPLIEFTTLFLSIIAAYNYPEWDQLCFILIFTWCLIAISVIDYDHFIIPDNFTQPLIWLGLVLNLYHWRVNIDSAVIGAIAGYLSLFLFTHLFKLITGKVGMGNGDFKLFALFGAWMGWQFLPFILITASIFGSLSGLLLIASGRLSKQHPIPFGPFLAFAGWISLIWGANIASYFSLFFI